ncbi:MAG: hypothetical protein QW201_02105 [Thermoproteota archaeon]
MRGVLELWHRSRELPEQSWKDEVLEVAVEGFRSLRERASLLDRETLSAKIANKEEEILAFILEDYFVTEFEKAILAEDAEIDHIRGHKVINFVIEIRRIVKKLIENIRIGSQIEPDIDILHLDKVITPYQLVIPLKEVQQFVGVDGKKHGPLRPGDIATIPNQDAEILISEGFVKRVE